MAGIFGVVSDSNCLDDLFLGVHYLQHRAQDYCGMFWHSGDDVSGNTHKGLLDNCFSRNDLRKSFGNYAVGSVSVSREPLSGFSRYQSGTLTFDGRLCNKNFLRDSLLKQGVVFSGYHFPNDILECDIVSQMIMGESCFEDGIEKLFSEIEGDFAIVNLVKDGVYAARGYGRKPLILGKKEVEGGNSYAVSSESSSFLNTGFEIYRDVKPGEVVFLNRDGISSVKQFDLGEKVRYGTFEWIYSAYPTSIIDGKSVSEVRESIGNLLAKEYPVDADIVSPIPNSGRWHAIGLANESKIPYMEVFIRYDHSTRSFTHGTRKGQQEVADTKLLPNVSVIKGNRIILVDDSIVRGTQTKNQVEKLKRFGAREVHGRIACPPLMCACNYGPSIKKDEDCIARRMTIDDICKTRGFDSLKFATVDMLEEAIGISKEKLCLSCWGE